MVKGSDLLQKPKFIKFINTLLSLNDGGNNMGEQNSIFEMIQTCNDFISQIEHEIIVSHKVLRDIYILKFKELESIVYDPVHYARCVLSI